MPRIFRTQPEYERLLIKEFLSALGYTISRPKWPDKPDALLTLCKGAGKTRVGIEHTEYFNDTVAGKMSPLTPVDEFWRIVQTSLVRRIGHRRHLTGISARVCFAEKLPVPPNGTELARRLAKELVDFIEAHPVRESQRILWRARDFDERCPTLRSLLASLSLLRETDDVGFASRCSWTCSNVVTGHVGLNVRYIKSAIENKNKKAGNYAWSDANEKWLLIAASGATLSNHAGPPMQNVDWAETELMELCRNSPFDRIVLWERVLCWYKWVKPDRRIVQYRNPYIH